MIAVVSNIIVEVITPNEFTSGRIGTIMKIYRKRLFLINYYFEIYRSHNIIIKITKRKC